MRTNGSDGRTPKGAGPYRHGWRQLGLHYRSVVQGALLCLAGGMISPSYNMAGILDQLSDLTDKAAQVVVTLKGRDNFNSEYLYDVSVKNLSADSLAGASLVVVLDRITDISGDPWTSGTSDSNLSRMEILGQEGETDDGKPYFRIPGGPELDLAPYTESSPATVRIRNKDYLVVFTPIFRVHGIKRMPAMTKAKDSVSPLSGAKISADELIQMFIEKGLLSEQEGRALYRQ